MNNGQKLRVGLLMLAWIGAVSVLVRINLRPKSSTSNLAAFNFPSTVPLRDWQFKTSSVIPPLSKKIFPKPLAQKKYQYQHQRDRLTLNVEMRYLPIENGSITLFIKDYTQIKSVPKVRYRPGVGYYGIGVEGTQAYLSTCINPRGEATFSDAQFKQNRYKYDFQASRLLAWLIWDEPLLDRRCLWTHFSLPIDNLSPTEAYRYLETSWFDWYGWWKSRFPKP